MTISESIRTLAEDPDAMRAMHLAVEDELIEWRDARRSVLGPANGFVVKEYDGSPSNIIRLGTRDGLRIALRALADHIEASA